MSGSGEERSVFSRMTKALGMVRLNAIHRYVGIVLAPFLVLQALSGVLLRLSRLQMVAGEGEAAAPLSAWYRFLAVIHVGQGHYATAYQLLIAAGVLWMAASGWVLYLRIRRARNRRPSA